MNQISSFQPKSPVLRLGSGNMHFSLTDPNCNKPLQSIHYIDEQPISWDDFIAFPVIYITKIFCYHNEDNSLILSYIDRLLSNPQYHSLLCQRQYSATFKFKNDYYCDFHYPNNRLNLLHALAHYTRENLPANYLSLLKTIVNASISAGVSPLEKSFTGHTPAAIILAEPFKEINILKFFALLHPNSLKDLTEEGECAMSIMAANLHSLRTRIYVQKEAMTFLAYNIPISEIDKNVAIYERMISKEYQKDILDIFKARREKEYISQGLPSLALNSEILDLKIKSGKL